MSILYFGRVKRGPVMSATSRVTLVRHGVDERKEQFKHGNDGDDLILEIATHDFVI